MMETAILIQRDLSLVQPNRLRSAFNRLRRRLGETGRRKPSPKTKSPDLIMETAMLIRNDHYSVQPSGFRSIVDRLKKEHKRLRK